jgi:acyl-CoA reductase-like NAD-dependent aldehyde dehydrogenase
MAAIETDLIIDGQWRPATNGARYEVVNPARPSELVGSAAAGGVDDVDLAYAAARAAAPEWAALSYQERAAYMNKVVDALVADQADLDERIALLTREHGKVLRESTMELTRLGQRFEGVASYADRLAEDDRFPGPPFDTIVTRHPYGVALLIIPWNWPLSILGASLPQALMAGNSVVIKPSEYAVLATARTIKLIADQLPPGVVNMVSGDGGQIGDALTTHREVGKICYTGGIEVGKHIMRTASENLTPVILELGGNDAAIVLADAELGPEAFVKMHMGGFISTGQVCMAMKRLYVHESRFSEVVDGLTAIEGKQVVGDGLLPEVTMGPLINAKQHAHVKALVDEAAAAGADVRAMGEVPDQELFDNGYFIRPTLVVDPDPSLGIVVHEQFGPALPLVKFSDEEEAIRLANDSNFGLASSVWTADHERGLALARRLEAGTTYLNAHGPTSQDGRAPFGGMKLSGIGRELGYEGVLEFQQLHTITSEAGTLFGT